MKNEPTEEISKRLHCIYLLMKEGSFSIAAKIFSEMNIVDTEKHLALPYQLRHLIWDLHEYLLLKNARYITVEEIMDTFEKIFVESTHNEE